MKAKWFLLLLAVPVLLIGAFGSNLLAYKFVIVYAASPLPEFPQNIQIFKIVVPEITAEYVSALGAKIGLKGEVRQSETVFYLQNKENGANLSVKPSNGYIEYNASNNLSTGNLPAPSFEEAKTFASNFLLRAGLLTDGMKLEEVMVQESGATPITLYVSFKSQVSSNNTLLPGNRSSVVIGHQGKVIRMTFRPIACIPDQVTRLIPVDQAFHELKATIREFKDDTPRLSLSNFRGYHFVSFDDVTLSYSMEPPTEIREHIYPFYVFKGQCRFFVTGQAYPFSLRISAVDIFPVFKRVQY